MTDTMTRVEIPADVRDNSQTVTDYAFMKHRSPNRGMETTVYRDSTLINADLFGYSHYQWHDTNQRTGQRCRFDMVVNRAGHVVHLFHTEYFTRVACHTGGWCHSYAEYYALAFKDGEPTTDGPLPYCGEHLRTLHRDLTVVTSERLIVGQHD